MLKRLNEILTRPMFGTRVIPKDGAVDPALFAEEEFPVYCPECDYLLRGLPDGKCPECGRPFQRGQLLVDQYVYDNEEVFLRRTRTGRVLYLCMRGVFICQLLFIASVLVCVLAVVISVRFGIDHPYISRALWVSGAGFISSLLLIALFGLVLLVRGLVVGLRGDEKRDRVIAAIHAPDSRRDTSSS